MSDAKPDKPKYEFGLDGPSEHLGRVREQIETVAKQRRHVFIQGPSGTGKENIARAIHHNSTRNDKPFVDYNCSLGSATMIDSDLFGHEKGSFTDAHEQTKGYLEEANGGTLFLDEIADTPLATQAKLLRAVQFGTFRRVGGMETIKVDVRFIAATNKNIEAEIESGRFRADLFSRLNRYRIKTNSLKSRSSDTICIFTNLLQSNKEEYKITKRDMTNIKFLVYHLDLPGNVRDIQNYATDLQHVVREFKIRLKRIKKEISRNAGKKSVKKLLTRYNKMTKALRLLNGDLLPVEKELIRAELKPSRVKLEVKTPQDVCLAWCVKVFEIVRLTQKTKMSQKNISELTGVRLQDVTPVGFEKRFGIPHPDDKRYVMNCPVDALKVLKRV